MAAACSRPIRAGVVGDFRPYVRLNEVIKFDTLVKYGTISPSDLDLFHRTDSVDEAYDIITKGLTENALGTPGPTL